MGGGKGEGRGRGKGEVWFVLERNERVALPLILERKKKRKTDASEKDKICLD